MEYRYQSPLLSILRRRRRRRGTTNKGWDHCAQYYGTTVLRITRMPQPLRLWQTPPNLCCRSNYGRTAANAAAAPTPPYVYSRTANHCTDNNHNHNGNEHANGNHPHNDDDFALTEDEFELDVVLERRRLPTLPVLCLAIQPLVHPPCAPLHHHQHHCLHNCNPMQMMMQIVRAMLQRAPLWRLNRHPFHVCPRRLAHSHNNPCQSLCHRHSKNPYLLQ